MILKTRHFGEIEIDDSLAVTFEDGLPGFEKVKKFTFIYQEDDTLFAWMQSIDEPNLAFAVVDPFSIKKDYDVVIDDETLRRLEIENSEDVQIFAIVVIPEDVKKISMNLKAPVIVNRKKGKGMQRILDTDKYTVRHYILEELQGQGGAENAGSDKEEKSVNRTK